MEDRNTSERRTERKVGRTKRERQLRSQKEQLDEFASVVSHDLRNPLGVAQGRAELLANDCDSEHLSPLLRSLDRMEEIISDTLTLARQGQVVSDQEPIELVNLVVDCWNNVQSDEATIEIEDEVTVTGDPSRLQNVFENLFRNAVEVQPLLDAELAAVRDSFPNAQFQVSGELPDVSVQANEMLSSVFRNILENAVRHNDKDRPEITVTCEENSETVPVLIADNGPGIPDNQKDQIFGKGEKGLDSPGSGIGLYLVHLLTDQFGGDVWVEDNEPEGAVFIVELPIAE